MSFLKKTWLARIGVGLNRFRMNNNTDVVLESNPVSVTQQGDQLSADNMNNLETRIDNAFTEMAGNLATIEVSPSQHNWTVGSQIVYNGILYKVSSAISTGDNLVVGTNITKYPVSDAISDINKGISTTVIDMKLNAVNKTYTVTTDGIAHFNIASNATTGSRNDMKYLTNLTRNSNTYYYNCRGTSGISERFSSTYDVICFAGDVFTVEEYSNVYNAQTVFFPFTKVGG